MFEVVLFENERGISPVYDFIMSLENRKLQAKIIGSLEVLADKGSALREPYSKHLEDGIFELRCTVARNTVRLLYFFHEGRVIVVTNGFIKRSQKTPAREIKLAKSRRAAYLAREGRQHDIA